MPRTTRTLVSLSLLAAAASAQLPPAEQRIHWPFTEPLLFGRAEVGRFVPYHGECVALAWGGDVALVYAPTVHDSCGLVNKGGFTGITAFATWPAAAGSDRDSLLVSNAEGLSLLTFDPPPPPPGPPGPPMPPLPPEPLDPPPPAFERTALTSLGANALDVACADFDGDGLRDVALIDPAGTLVRVLLDSAQGFAEEHAFSTAFGALLDVEPIQWDMDGGPELAVLSHGGTEVFDADGTRLWGRARPIFADPPRSLIRHCMAVMPPQRNTPPLSTLDCLAVVQANGTGSQQLLTVFGYLGNDPAVPLGTTAVVNCDAGDRDGDGDEELALGLRTGCSTTVLRNRNGEESPLFSASAREDVVIADAAEEGSIDNAAEVCLADLDDDGRAEVFSAYGNQDWLAVVPPELAEPETLTFDGPFQVYDVRSQDLSATYGDAWDPLHGGAQIFLSNVWGTLDPTTTTHLELILWGPESGENVGVSYHSRTHALYEIPATHAFRTQGALLNIGFSLTDLPPSGSPTPFPDERYYIEVRPVKWNGTAISNPLQTQCGGFTFDPAGTGGSVQHLLDNPGADGNQITMLVNGSPLFTLSAIGGFVRQYRIPPKLRPKVLPIIEPPRIVPWSPPA